MLTFAFPWAFLLLPLPWLLRRLLPTHEESRTAVIIPGLSRLSRLTGHEPGQGAAVLTQPLVQRVTFAIVWVLLLVALARPQWIGEPLQKTVPTRDLLLAVDLSGSMEAEDFTDARGQRVDRLTAVKQILDQFLAKREGDRVGLIFFGSAPFVQVPFTQDLDVCRQLLDEAQVRMAGPQTVLGDAIGLAIRVFQESSDIEDRVLIAMTDGNDTGSQVPPEEAAKIARDQSITIHTVAVGDPTSAGEEQLDEESLKDVAKTTGGGYFRANNREELAAAYGRLDEIETRKVETLSHRPKDELFFWPLGVMLLLTLLYHLALDLSFVRRSQVTARASTATVAVVLGLGIGSTTFHFLRPAWLLLLPVAVFLAVRILHRESSPFLSKVADAHLLRHLLSDPQSASRVRPVHLLLVIWIVGIVAMSGPTWRREPSPFAEDEAALMIAVGLSPTMTTEDVQPSRLERAKQKIHDLLALRQGARAGLLAYAGSTHLVMPLTRDARVIETFANALTPEIMPIQGNATVEALGSADRQLTSSGYGGSILLVTDGIDEDQLAGLKAYRERGGTPVHVLAVVADPSGLEEAVKALGAALTVVSPDDEDVRRIASRVESDYRASLATAGGSRWSDMGYWLVPLLVLIGALWGRRGWMVRHA